METYQPMVSVIIPLYNQRANIEECIDSVFAQTCQSFEILCIDDGSTDGGPEFCETKYGGDERFHLVRQANAGTWAARNHGLDLAQGMYVTFLDHDDFLGTNAFERMTALAEETQADVVASMGRYLLRDGDNRLVPLSNDPAHASHAYVLSDMMEERLVHYRKPVSEAVWNKFFRRSFLENSHIRFQPVRYRDDCIFVLSCLFHAKTFVCTPFLYYVYRISHGSALRAHKTLDDVEKVIETMLQVLRGVDRALSDIPYFDIHPEAMRIVKEKQLDELLETMRHWGFYPTPEEYVDVMKETIFQTFASLKLSAEESAFLLTYLFDRFNANRAIVERVEGKED